MNKILAVDYGMKRCGLAITDSLQMIASPLTTVVTSEIFRAIESLILKERLECIVVGEARYLNGEDSETTIQQKKFVGQLNKKFPTIRIERIDEMYTSKMASQAIVAGGMKKKDRMKKENLDKVSAALILQSFLERRA